MDIFYLIIELLFPVDELKSLFQTQKEIQEPADVAEDAYSYFEILQPIPAKKNTVSRKPEAKKGESLKSFFKRIYQKRLKTPKILKQMKKTKLEPIPEVPEN